MSEFKETTSSEENVVFGLNFGPFWIVGNIGIWSFRDFLAHSEIIAWQ